MRMLAVCFGALVIVLTVPVPACANPATFGCGPAAIWVVAPSVASALPAQDGASVRIHHADSQTRPTAARAEHYFAYRLTILRPEALVAGDITLHLNPAAGEARVHLLRIIRAGKPIDVLSQTRFHVIRREENLEQAMLSGKLAAAFGVGEVNLRVPIVPGTETVCQA